MTRCVYLHLNEKSSFVWRILGVTFLIIPWENESQIPTAQPMMQLRDHWFTRASLCYYQLEVCFRTHQTARPIWLVEDGATVGTRRGAGLQPQQTVVKCLKDGFQGRPVEPLGMKQVFSCRVETQQPSRTEVLTVRTRTLKVTSPDTKMMIKRAKGAQQTLLHVIDGWVRGETQLKDSGPDMQHCWKWVGQIY